ncbi:hypothetical protein SAMN05444385_10822 [Tritonibacter mobilis]|jgi:hypothetical protein|nr:hypothetical protein SAMN05444385_10822 [Tritonibacter mobilis]
MRAPSGATADEAHVSGADFSEAQNQQEASGVQDLSVLAQRSAHDPIQSGWASRHQLCPDASGLPASRGGHGLA